MDGAYVFLVEVGVDLRRPDRRVAEHLLHAAEVGASCDEVRRIEGPEDLPLDERPGGDDERSLNAATAAAIALHHLLRG